MAKIGSDKIASLKIALYKYPPLGRKREGRLVRKAAWEKNRAAPAQCMSAVVCARFM